MDQFRRWLMKIIAGNRLAYWVSDKAIKDVGALHTIPGVGAAIILADEARRGGWTSQTVTFEGWIVTITKAQE